MFRRSRVKPSKSQSIIGMVMGIVFVIIGISQLRLFGLFGVIWTLAALGITIMHAYNVFSEKGISTFEMDIETMDSQAPKSEDFETRMRQLNALKEDGLISEAEFEAKRKTILEDKW
ncbi:SHOCT domain-containing protein [Fusibacter ferrireducens]|uniref:SHOCT domain-containing protein n=1 Tax=Fusibacter ferrireducens TaxID=2785058 RepID=A0ABR9ZVM3_9FIRM|nr:SHOCT domain-containing protein [Fusibacter ferrireducens]MBF4694218.1 SHOCT domain-containing protein [Fusibacter ferrireducens]